MLAALRTKYGPPSVLEVKEVAKPVPKENEILVRVQATTVNRTDCGVLTGLPFVFRFFIGLFKPTLPITGTDFAGFVEEVGQQVTQFKAGDRVWGFNDQGLASQAQYLTIREDKAIATIPQNFGFAEAVACAEAAHYAINFLNKVTLTPGQKVMVNGATGGIGSAAVQLLKNQGIYVAATCATPYIEKIKSLGADKVIDYTKEDFTKDTDRYDFVFDAVGKSSFGQCKPLLLPGGVYISSELGPRSENPFLALWTPLRGGKKVIFPLPTNIRKSIYLMRALMEAGKFTPLMDRHYPLEQIADAYTYVLTGQKIGNVIIDMP
jgi:NADPH:quinone reductase-like Zn-dependent oxidoreductase